MNKEKFFGLGAIEIKGIKDDGSFTAIASDMSVDRYGEIVDVEGWDLKGFKGNPVLLWGHDHSIPAIGKATKIWIEDKKLMFNGIFARTPFAQEIKMLVEDGIINSFSVGFMAKKMEGNTFTDQELLEISFVNVPANANAMMLSAEKLGLALAVKAFKGELTAKDCAIVEEKETEEVEEVKEEEVIEEKGKVQDIIDNPSEWKIKDTNMTPVFDVFYSFCDVYYSEMTAASEFGELFAEMLKIMGKIAKGEPIETAGSGKSIASLFNQEKCVIFTKGDLDSFKKSLEEKAGKVISAKNAEIIQNAVASMEVAGSSLKDVLALSEDKSAVVAPTEEIADNKNEELEKKELVKVATKSLMRVLQLSKK